MQRPEDITMQFIDNKPIYKIIRVTGPQHNMLVVRLSDKKLDSLPAIEDLESNDKCVGKLIAEEVRQQVMQGVEQASLELGRSYFVEKIQYLSTDSLPVSIYKDLAVEIVRRVNT